MLLSCENLGKSYGGDDVFTGLSLHVEHKDIIAVVGKNGCGKSTLLKILSGDLSPDEGTLKVWQNASIGFLSQTRSSETAEPLSGGEATKKELVKLFSQNHSVLLLDEPTNHLDVEAIEWLEEKVASFKGALLVVSHDRYFLDRFATKVLDLNESVPQMYTGNYSAYYSKREARRLARLRRLENEQREIARQEEIIQKLRSFNRQKSIKRAESRQKMLDKMERSEELVDVQTHMSLSLKPETNPGKDILDVHQLKKAFKDIPLFSDLSFHLERGEHVAIVGANGTGKTTLLKILTGAQVADEGHFKFGTNVFIGYYDQAQENFCETKNLYDEIHDTFPQLTETKVRQTLAAFSFFEEDIKKTIMHLSGGERGRLSLAKLMLSQANVLLLDEPTNHLDMDSREILEDAINRYTGTVLYVSHDRYFMNQTADRILDLSGKTLRSYLGNYDEYLEKKQELIEKGLLSEEKGEDALFESVEPKQISENKLSWEDAKRKKALAQKNQRIIDQANKDIKIAEERIDAIDASFLDPDVMGDGPMLKALSDEKEALETKLLELYELLETQSVLN